MKIYYEQDLVNFDFWSGAAYTCDTLTGEQLGQIEAILEDMYPDGIDQTDLNDIFRFENDWIAQMCGFDNWEALEKYNRYDGVCYKVCVNSTDADDGLDDEFETIEEARKWIDENAATSEAVLDYTQDGDDAELCIVNIFDDNDYELYVTIPGEEAADEDEDE